MGFERMGKEMVSDSLFSLPFASSNSSIYLSISYLVFFPPPSPSIATNPTTIIATVVATATVVDQQPLFWCFAQREPKWVIQIVESTWVHIMRNLGGFIQGDPLDDEPRRDSFNDESKRVCTISNGPLSVSLMTLKRGLYQMVKWFQTRIAELNFLIF